MPLAAIFGGLKYADKPTAHKRFCHTDTLANKHRVLFWVVVVAIVLRISYPVWRVSQYQIHRIKRRQYLTAIAVVYRNPCVFIVRFDTDSILIRLWIAA